MKALDSDVEEEDEGAAERVDGGGKSDGEYAHHHLQRVQKLIYAAKVCGQLMA